MCATSLILPSLLQFFISAFPVGCRLDVDSGTAHLGLSFLFFLTWSGGAEGRGPPRLTMFGILGSKYLC